jgi:hypothetical protein
VVGAQPTVVGEAAILALSDFHHCGVPCPESEMGLRARFLKG